jgi:hypothetical protein
MGRYGVVHWPHFDQSSDNRAQLLALARMVHGPDQRRFVLRVNRDPLDTWRGLEAYGAAHHF